MPTLLMVRVSRRVAVGNHERRHVLHHLRAAADHRQFADAAKLVHRRQPANHRMILDRHVARERRDVGHDDVVAQRAIVRDVAVGEDVIVRADARDFAVAGRAVNGDVFAEGVAVADFGARDAALPFQILRLQPDAGERKNFVVLSEFRVAVNDDVRMQFATVAERHVFADDAVRPDLATGTDLRFGMNDGSRMNHGNLRFAIYDLRAVRGSRGFCRSDNYGENFVSFFH